jgi:histidine ammonia-lyase
MKSVESSVLNFRANTGITSVSVDGQSLTLESLIALGNGAKISISQDTSERLQMSRDVVDKIVSSKVPTYGINTGFGLLSHTDVPSDELAHLQLNLIRSHASGVGNPLDPHVVRRIMALRINTLARGRSGVSTSTFRKLVDLFNSGCTPQVPCQGTVGASGDLAPLAHIALGLIGEGKIFDPQEGKYLPAAQVLSSHGLSPASLQAKDGLSLVNGTQFITGIGSFALQGGINCMQVIQPISALGLVALHGHMKAMDPRVFQSRPHVGSALVSKVIRALIPPNSHETTTKDVQDYYSIRCIPQVHGPVLEMIPFLRSQLEVEMNSSTDNPLIFAENICPITGTHLPDNVLSAGNFHGEYPAKALDTLALYVGELGRISTARIMLLVDPNRSRKLPPFLAANPGVNSGFMCWELTAVREFLPTASHSLLSSFVSLLGFSGC